MMGTCLFQIFLYICECFLWISTHFFIKPQFIHKFTFKKTLKMCLRENKEICNLSNFPANTATPQPQTPSRSIPHKSMNHRSSFPVLPMTKTTSIYVFPFSPTTPKLTPLFLSHSLLSSRHLGALSYTTHQKDPKSSHKMLFQESFNERKHIAICIQK